jgi:hypothetical protein
MTALALRLRREDGAEGIGHCFEIITAAPWSAELSTYVCVEDDRRSPAYRQGYRTEDGASVRW